MNVAWLKAGFEVLSPRILTWLRSSCLSLGGSLNHKFYETPIPIHDLSLAVAAEDRPYWGLVVFEAEYGSHEVQWNNTYNELRVIGLDYNLYYNVWCLDGHQLYDFRNDLYEIDNLLVN